MLPESWLCKDAPIVRMGSQLQSTEDQPNLEPDDDDEVEGMTATILHQEDDKENIKFIDPNNWRELTIGHVQKGHQAPVDSQIYAASPRLDRSG